VSQWKSGVHSSASGSISPIEALLFGAIRPEQQRSFVVPLMELTFLLGCCAVHERVISMPNRSSASPGSGLSRSQGDE
jgi:hypothetical protein